MTETKQIPEQSRRLGRHVHHDPRSRDFPAERATKLHTVSHSAVGLPLNQGQIGSCTANALCGALNAAPNFKKGDKVYKEADAVQLYEWETAAEGQPYPPNDPGGSGTEVCKVAKQHYWISKYTHAFGIEHALQALVLRPVITGVNWYTSFDTPDANGIVSKTPGATIRGGHEFVAVQLVVPDTADGNLDDIVVWFENSWGKSFGRAGVFGMTASTWSELLTEGGDVTVPVK